MPLPYLSVLTALPVAGAIAALVAGRHAKSAKIVALSFAFAALGLALFVACHFDHTVGAVAFQFEERHAWVPELGIDYRVAVDGLGVLMLLLSAIVTPIAMAASWRVTERVSLYFALVLTLQACLFGAFTALNFVHWFMYWELCLIPAFFLIKLWGGPRRSAAAMQFLVYTMVGSVAMLLSFLMIFLATHKFDLLELAQMSHDRQLIPSVMSAVAGHGFISRHIAMLIFAGAFLGFAVKVPLLPFHTWLPPTYSEAPTGTTILLTGAMSKMGLYGFVRILLPIFTPQIQALMKPLLCLAVATILFSTYAAMAQRDIKRIFAYSSINHLGYCVLAIFAVAKPVYGDASLISQRYAAMDGVLLQMFNHGLTAAVIFWFIAMIESRSDGVRGIADFGGLRKVAPVFASLMGVALFSSLGLPGLNGFVGEFLIFKGSFPLATVATSVSVLGLLVTAIFILTFIQRVFAGPLPPRWVHFPDLNTPERFALAPAIALMFVLGLYPQLITSLFNTTAMQIVNQLKF